MTGSGSMTTDLKVIIIPFKGPVRKIPYHLVGDKASLLTNENLLIFHFFHSHSDDEKSMNCISTGRLSDLHCRKKVTPVSLCNTFFSPISSFESEKGHSGVNPRFDASYSVMTD